MASPKGTDGGAGIKPKKPIRNERKEKTGAQSGQHLRNPNKKIQHSKGRTL